MPAAPKAAKAPRSAIKAGAKADSSSGPRSPSPLPNGSDVASTCPCGGGCPRCVPPANGTAGEGAPGPVPRSAGQPLPSTVRGTAERSFGTDFGHVRIHTGAEAAAAAERNNASALTLGSDIVFGPSRYDPGSPAGRRLLAHELTHVVQFGRPPAAPANTRRLESEARDVSRRVSGGGRAGAINGRASLDGGPLFDDKKKDDDDQVVDPFKDWKNEADSVLLIYGDDKLFILPGAKTIFFPTEKTQQQFEQSSAHTTQDLGTLFEVPATGASGTRIFQAGKRSAMVLDAGYDPTPGQSRTAAAMYLPEVAAITSRLGIQKISRIQPIHGHSDHVLGIPLIIGTLQIKPENVVIPAEFETLGPVRQIEATLRDPNNTVLTSRGFGPAWNPQRPPKDKGGPGDLYRGSFMVGELVVEMVALRSALKNTRAAPDLASYLTKVTRRTDNAKVVLLGDFRGADLETIRNTMETQSPGSWNEFFRGVTTISGFSHHVGRMEQGDVAGMMALLDATLLQTGKLRVVEQTNRAVGTQGRADTLEFAARLGVEVSYTDMPSTAGPSSVSATRDTTTATGPSAVAQPTIASNLTAGMERLQKLIQAQTTIEQWRPWLEEINGKDKIDAVTSQFESSIAQLRQSLRQATLAAANVRGERRPANTTGPRDYTAGGGALGQAYTTALGAIPAQVPAEATLTAEAQRGLEELRNQKMEEIPLKVAIYRAVTRGEYSNQAFTYMMGQLDPMTRDELIGRKPGTTGALVPRNVAFERVRAQFNFQSSVMSGETISIQHLSPGGQIRARAVGGALLALELWNDIGSPLWESHKISQQINVTTNLAPFLRRMAFWQQMGIQPKCYGIVDPTFGSPKRIDDVAEINKKLKSDDLDAFIIEEPALTDADVLRLGVWLSQNVRNFDEYATLFDDSFQDAMSWKSTGGTWETADWQVRVGYYETSGSNHVEEKWVKHDKLTEFMRHYIPWLIANTRMLLDQAGKGGPEPAGFTSMLGTMSPGGSGTTGALKRVKLKKPEEVPIVRVPWTGDTGAQWEKGGGGSDLAKLTTPTPPEFYVLEKSGDELRVMGADFNTYAAIRFLATRRRSIGTYGNELNHEFFRNSKNESGYVWIDEVLTEAVPDGSTSGAAAPPPVAQPPPAVPLPLPKTNSSGSAGQTQVLPGPWRDAPGGGKSLIGPKLFGPLPNDPNADEKQRSILPGIGGSF